MMKQNGLNGPVVVLIIGVLFWGAFFDGLSVGSADGKPLRVTSLGVSGDPRRPSGCEDEAPVPSPAAPSPATASAERYDVLFDVDAHEINQHDRELLDGVAGRVLHDPRLELWIRGHTDESGSTNYNRALSRRRAGAVADYFAGKKIEKERLSVSGLGEDRAEARRRAGLPPSLNRRAEILIIRHNDMVEDQQ